MKKLISVKQASALIERLLREPHLCILLCQAGASFENDNSYIQRNFHDKTIQRPKVYGSIPVSSIYALNVNCSV